MLRITLLLISNFLISFLLSINTFEYNQKFDKLRPEIKKDWIYNYSEKYLFFKRDYLFCIKENNLLWKTKIINNSDIYILETGKEIILLSKNNIKLLSSITGRIIWNTDLDEYNYKLPTSNDKEIFLIGNNKIYFIDKKNGNISKIVNLYVKKETLTKKKENKKKETSVKIVYLKSNKEKIDKNKYFFSLYKLDDNGNLINNFIVEKNKKDEYFNNSDPYFINKENTIKSYRDKKIFNLNKTIIFNNSKIIYKKDFKVYSFNIKNNIEEIIYNNDIENIIIDNDNYIFFDKNKIISNKWEYKLETDINNLYLYNDSIIINDGLYRLKSINIKSGKLNWIFNSSSIIFNLFLSNDNLYLVTSLSTLDSKNYIYSLDIKDGSFKWLFEFPENEWFYTVISKDKNIFIVNTKSVTSR